jgi:hypothetical protein
MTSGSLNSDAQSGDYRGFLEAQPVATLRDWALELAKDKRDVGFYWDVAKHLPATEEANFDWAAYDLLRVRYVDYLVEHADDRRFDRRTGSPHPTTG